MKPTPENVDGILMDYQNMGFFEQINGMIIGRPMYYTEHKNLRLQEHVLERTKAYSFPIVSNMDLGHTAPQFTLPLGCRAHIDTEERLFEIIETAAA